MDFADWLKAQPRIFPEQMGDAMDNTPFQNPLIGETQAQTYENVRSVVNYFIQMALPSYTEKADISMTEDSTWGFINLLQCVTGAITFELKHRPNGGEPLDDGNKEEGGK